MGGIKQITGIAMIVADLNAACTFYGALGFVAIERRTDSGAAFAALTGMADARADVAVMKLGEQRIELAAFTPAGAPYPAERSAADPWFQHFAIVVSDMNAAHAWLESVVGWTSISTGGPQLLPPVTGGVVAFKFRDPDGHPLELSWLPPAIAGHWATTTGPGPFLGIDHSALAASDTAASVAFYTGLGLTVAATQTNSGPAQDRLDGLNPAVVEITTLTTPGNGPHVELLNYRIPPRPRHALAINDIAATRLTVRGEGEGLAQDPDGHWLEWRT